MIQITDVFFQKDYEELAVSVMSIVDRLVHKTNVPQSLSLSHTHTHTQIHFVLYSCAFLLLYLPTHQEKIESSTDVLKDILKPVVDEVEEIRWPPRDPEALKQMEKVRF